LTEPRTLDEFAFESSGGKGIAVDMLNRNTTVVVKTLRSCYRITVIEADRQLVLVDGGVFRDPVVVRLSGATFGGSAIKLGWIIVGLRLEFGSGSRRITSSPVMSFAIERPSVAEVSCRAA
jgi:hypothetical protein